MNRQKSRTFKKDKKRLEINREPQKRKASSDIRRLQSMADSDQGSAKNKKEEITNTHLSESDNIILNRMPTMSNSQNNNRSKPYIALENSSKKSFQLQNRSLVARNQATSFMRYNSIQQIVPGFVQLLKSKGLIQVSLNTCTLQTSRLSRICLYLLNIYSSSKNMNNFALRLFTQQQLLSDFLKKAQLSKLPTLNKLNPCRLFSYCSEIISQTIPNMQQLSYEQQIAQLKKESLRLKQQLKVTGQKLDAITMEVNRKKSESSHLSYRLDKMQTDLTQLRRQQQSTKTLINQQEKLLARVQEKMLEQRKHCERQQFRNIQSLVQQEERLIDCIKLHGTYFRCYFPQNKPSKMSNPTSSERLLQKEWRQLQRVLDDPREDYQKKSAFASQFFRKTQQQYTSNIEKMQFMIKQKDSLINKFLSYIQQLENLKERKSKVQKQMKQGLCLIEVSLERYAQSDKSPSPQNKMFPEGIMTFLQSLFNNLIMFRSIL